MRLSYITLIPAIFSLLIAAPSFAFDLERAIGNAVGNVITNEIQRSQSSSTRKPAPQAQRPSEVQMDRSTRRQVQAALNRLQFQVGVEDGIIGRGTRGGIQAWQRAQGFPATGYLTANQLNILLSPPAAPIAQSPPSTTPIDPTSPFGNAALPNFGFAPAESANNAGVASAGTTGNTSAAPINLLATPVQPSDATNPTPVVGGRVISLVDRDVWRLSLNGEPPTSDRWAVAFVQKLPQANHTEALRGLVQRGFFETSFGITSEIQNDTAALQALSEKIMSTPLPQFERITLKGSVDRRNVARGRQQDGTKGSVTLTLPSDINMVKPFFSTDMFYRSGIGIDFEIPNLPDLSQVNLKQDPTRSTTGSWWPPQDAGPASTLNTVELHIHIDVVSYTYDPSRLRYKIEGKYIGADLRTLAPGEASGSIVYVYPQIEQNNGEKFVPSDNPHRDLAEGFISDLTNSGTAKNLRSPFSEKGSFDLRRATEKLSYFDIFAASSVLNDYPEIIEDDELFPRLASVLLGAAERAKVIRGIDNMRNEALPKSRYFQYRGVNAFDRRDVLNRMRTEVIDVINARTFNAPFAAHYVVPVRIGEYDFNEQYFPILIHHNAFDYRIAFFNSETYGGSFVRLPEGFSPPDTLPIPEQSARNTLALLGRRGNPGGFLSIEVVVPELAFDKPYLNDFGQIAMSGQKQFSAQVMSVKLFADEALQELIFEFPVTVEEVQRAAGMTAEDMFAREFTHVPAILGTLLAQKSPRTDEIRQAILTKTPSYSVVSDAVKQQYGDLIISRYLEHASADGLWTSAEAIIRGFDLQSRSLLLAVQPNLKLSAPPEGFELPELRLSTFRERPTFYEVQTPLPIDELVAYSMGIGIPADASDGYSFQTLQQLVGQSLTPQSRTTVGHRAFVLFKPVFEKFDGANQKNLSFTPEISEAFIVFENIPTPGSQIVLHEVAGQTKSGTLAASEPRPKLTADTMIEVRKSGTEEQTASGIVMSCIVGRDLPATYQSANLVPLPVSDVEAGEAYLQFFGDQNLWLTTVGCLQTGLGALINNGQEEQLVFKEVGSATFRSARDLELVD